MSIWIRGNRQIVYKKPFKMTFRFAKNYLFDLFGSILYIFYMDRIHMERKKGSKYKVCICGIFKNEGNYLKEWVEYHKIVGVEHFFLYNNNSSDDFITVLQPYIDDGVVTLIEWVKEHDQMGAYRHCISNYRTDSDWIGFIDIDEFVVPIEENTIIEILRYFENRPAVLVYWKFFGFGGLMDRPKDTLVTESFVVCGEKLSNIGKVFYNTKYDFAFDDKRNSILHHIMWCKYKNRISLPTVNIFDKVCFFFEGIAFSRNRCLMQINHYFSKSRDEYFEKIGKGDVFFAENPHTIDYWFAQEEICNSADYKIFKYMARLKSALIKGEDY